MVMTLILLVVMALGTAVSVRLSLTTDMVGANLRERSIAFQAAESALRYCEERVIKNFSEIPMLVDYSEPYEWMDDKVWQGSASMAVPRSELGLLQTVKYDPQCLFRYLSVDEWRKISPPEPGTVTAESRGFDPERFAFVRITARGFGPQYIPYTGDDYQTARGSEVRLQSMVRAIK